MAAAKKYASVRAPVYMCVGVCVRVCDCATVITRTTTNLSTRRQVRHRRRAGRSWTLLFGRRNDRTLDEMLSVICITHETHHSRVAMDLGIL